VQRLAPSKVELRPASEARGRGLSQRLLGEALRSETTRGVGLAALYPTTLSLYRKSGFEIAGVSSLHGLCPRDLPARPSTHRVFTITRAEAMGFGAAHGQRENGNLLREEALWARLWRPAAHPPKLYGLHAGDDPSDLRAIVGLGLGRSDELGFDLSMKFWAARDQESVADLLTLVRAHGTLAQRLEWWGAPVDALLVGLDARPRTTKVEPWMLRLLDVGQALALAGLLSGSAAELRLASRIFAGPTAWIPERF